MSQNLDAVYLVRSGENEELRYSLRSLKNLPHGKVWMFGNPPDWVQNVQIVKGQEGIDKWQRAKSSLKKVVRSEVSEDFILFNDDFFVMDEILVIPTITHGTLEEQYNLPKYKDGWGNLNTYARILRSTEIQLGTYPTKNFDVHYPMIFNKERLKQVLLGHDSYIATRSFYGNFYRLDSIEADDCKIYDSDTIPKSQSFISTTDESFKGRAGEYIKRQFKEKSIYERE